MPMRSLKEYLATSIEEYGIINQTTFEIDELGISGGRSISWTQSGYLTMGDNNDMVDQITNISPQPVKLEWISGKARQEIPWLGTINLFFGDLMNGKNTTSNVHEDSLICLGIVIAILISIPILLDIRDYFKEKGENQP